MQLNNPLPTPTGLRFCYWHSDYVSEGQIFYASKMTDQENRAFFALEDLLALEKHEKNKVEALGGDKRHLGALAAQAETLSIDGQTLRVKTGKKEKNSYFLDMSVNAGKGKNACGLCNTHNNAGVPSKTVINRLDFLAR